MQQATITTDITVIGRMTVEGLTKHVRAVCAPMIDDCRRENPDASVWTVIAAIYAHGSNDGDLPIGTSEVTFTKAFVPGEFFVRLELVPEGKPAGWFDQCWVVLWVPGEDKPRFPEYVEEDPADVFQLWPSDKVPM